MTAPLIVGVCGENAPGERRVALVPDAVGAVQALGLEVLVESGAGAASWLPDLLYRQSGARVATRDELLHRADILVGVRPPAFPAGHRFRHGQVLIALLDPLRVPFDVRRWADEGVTAIGLDLAPDTSVLARPMDAVASQDRLAGYKAALLAADRFGHPLSGTVVPAAPREVRALVLGSDAAARQAADTLRRLGATVAVDDSAPPYGPRFSGLVAGADIVITTVRPRLGLRPPVLVTARAMAGMRPGSVIIDTAAGPDGGNVEGVLPESTMTVGPGVTLIGAGRLPERIPQAASATYAHNVTALLGHLVRDGALLIDPADPVQAAMLVTHGNMVLHKGVWQLIVEQTAVAGLP
ncbi:NAD(P) transhydrogenase subunit alpha [Streptomyces sp. NBC_01343]|uniref:NAD(P) transhydrogenase subunit alpha n=1 Tax=Streptomyces sp. NBC_01343 TaxID=2903832 RepID=UPI002E107E68|nr:NAD(P) transhydrogenase subunit alpha [Streptomyces sp. NBC_01343]